MKKFILRIVKRKFLFALIILIVVVGGYFGYKAIKGPATVQPQYVTAQVTKGTLVISVSGSGQVAAVNQTSIQPQVSGVVVAIPVQDNQSVKAGDLIVKLDTTNNERAVRDARANLDDAQLSLDSLLAPPTTSTLLQTQQSVVQAQQSLNTNTSNLTTDYSNAYTDVSDAFIDLPSTMTGLNNVLFSTSVNKIQADADAYANLVSYYYPSISTYEANAIASYNSALIVYNTGLADYKNTSINSSTSTVETILAETYNVLKSVSVANTSVKNFLDVVANQLQQLQQQKPPAQLTIDETDMQNFITTVNGHLSTLLQIQNSLANDKQNITSANLSVDQTQAALEQLQSGPTQLSIQTQQLAVTKAQNALSDAEQNLQNDYVLAPYDGIITNITAKIGQPVSGTVATLVSNAQLAQTTLNEIDVVNVKVGEQATVTFDALPNVTLTGKVSEVDTIGTVSQGVVSYNVQVALDLPNSQVKPGMSDNVSIITIVKPDTLLIPSAAVATKQGISTVQKMGTDGKPVQTPVTIGLSNNTMTEILSGLNEGDSVVTKTTTGLTTPTQTTTSGLGGLRILGGGGGGAAGR